MIHVLFQETSGYASEMGAQGRINLINQKYSLVVICCFQELSMKICHLVENRYCSMLNCSIVAYTCIKIKVLLDNRFR